MPVGAACGQCVESLAQSERLLACATGKLAAAPIPGLTFRSVGNLTHQSSSAIGSICRSSGSPRAEYAVPSLLDKSDRTN